jgi:hypothetical protein
MQNSIVLSGCSSELYSIICSLNYLCLEAEAIGMCEASKIIRAAIIKIKIKESNIEKSLDSIVLNDDIVMLAMKFIDVYAQSSDEYRNEIIQTLDIIKTH